MVVEKSQKLKNKELLSARYNLVKEIKETYPINDLFPFKDKKL